jgi:tetratricopeptide (TPR) repeat protein
MTRLVVTGLLALAGPVRADEAGAGAPAPGVRGLVEKVDAAWPRRDEAGRLGRIRDWLAEAAQLASDDYGVLWRQARYEMWLAEQPGRTKREQSELGKKAWELADRATEADPKRVEGWFYAAGGVGNYSQGIGILSALSQGLEGKFKERLGKAEAIEPGFLDGGVQNAWGRFWYELPWPKYSARKCEEALRKAIVLNPANVRARVYLAELYLKESRKADAKAELEGAIAREPGAYDPPEERRWQARARELIADTKW